MTTLERAHRNLNVQRHRIERQVSFICHLRSDGHIQESKEACKILSYLLERQTELYEELWRVADVPAQ